MTEYSAWCESLVGTNEQVPVIETGTFLFLCPDHNGQDGVRFWAGNRLAFTGRVESDGRREITLLPNDEL